VLTHDHVCPQVRHRYICTAGVGPNGSIPNAPHDGHCLGAMTGSYQRRPFRVAVRRSRSVRRSGFGREPCIGALTVEHSRYRQHTSKSLVETVLVWPAADVFLVQTRPQC
jgi:hypothetical protein